MVVMVVPPDILTVVQDIANIATQIILGIFRGFLISIDNHFSFKSHTLPSQEGQSSFVYFFARGKALTNSVTDTLRSVVQLMRKTARQARPYSRGVQELEPKGTEHVRQFRRDQVIDRTWFNLD